MYRQKNGVHSFKSVAGLKNGVFKALRSDPSFNSELVEALGDEDNEDAELEDMDLDVLAIPDDVPVAVVDAPYAVAKAAARGRGRGTRGGHSGGRVVAVAPLPPGQPAVPMPDILGPMKFDFACHDKVVTVHIDGYSHDTGNRRCYAACLLFFGWTWVLP